MDRFEGQAPMATTKRDADMALKLYYRAGIQYARAQINLYDARLTELETSSEIDPESIKQLDKTLIEAGGNFGLAESAYFEAVRVLCRGLAQVDLRG